jgi:hypothetical protein
VSEHGAGHVTPFSEHDPITLVELVNRVVDRGVILGGDVTISVADVDLLYLGLRVLLCSPDRIEVAASRQPTGASA